MGAIASLEKRNVPVAPGAQAAAQIRIRNNGVVVDLFTIGVLGDAGAWSFAEPASVSLFPGAEQSITITFRPPRASTVPAGPMPFGVRVASQEDPGGSVVEEGILEIAPYSDTTVELAPRTSRGSRGARHDLAIDNRGNVPLNASIVAADPDRTLAFDVRPPAVVADPGTAAFSKVSVKPRQRFWRGQPKTRTFRVQIESPGQVPVAADGTMLQEPILPAWFLKAVVLLLAAIIALILFWFLFLRPAVQSAAQERAEQVLTDNNIPVKGSGKNGGATPTQPPTAPTPTPKPGQTPAPGVTPAPPSTPRDGRILANDPPVTPTDGKQLFITDLVFSNPDVGSGNLHLRRSGQDLLVLRLEDFRDLDFHFVTPIRVDENQNLVLRCPDVQCDGAAVYFSGYERSP